MYRGYLPTLFHRNGSKPSQPLANSSANALNLFSSLATDLQLHQRSNIATTSTKSTIGKMKHSWIFPSPYEHALMSQAIYFDNLKGDTWIETSVPSEHKVLYDKGWRFAKAFIEDNDYRGGVFVHDKRKQAVIAHRGSLNATSWITDYETVIQRKPGGFVGSVINTLSDDLVLTLRKEGYDLSTTGHSLGGFLAQVAVYWSHRRDQDKTYYPKISATVFDSPGAVEFLEVLQSNLPREKEAIHLYDLNIHHFAAMPTIVSTYGTHAGTLWHLAQPQDMGFAFISAHRMENILSGFDPNTEQPKTFRQMVDWPKADYSQYNTLEKLMSSLRSQATWLPFTAMNQVYKFIKTKSGSQPVDTWYEQIFKAQENQFLSFLKTHQDSGYVPKLDELEKGISDALKTHYAAHSETVSQKSMNLHHFNREVQFVLTDVVQDKATGQNKERLSQFAKIYSQEELALLDSFHIKSQGNVNEVVLAESFDGTVFEFHQEITVLCRKKQYTSSKQFLKDTITQLQNRLASETNSQAKINLNSAISDIEKSLALKMTGPDDYNPERIEDIIRLTTELQQKGFRNVLINHGCAIATKEGSIAVLIPASGVSESSATFARDLVNDFQKGLFSSRQNTEKEATSDNLGGDHPGKK